jgi:hypothetical protein
MSKVNKAAKRLKAIVETRQQGYNENQRVVVTEDLRILLKEYTELQYRIESLEK